MARNTHYKFQKNSGFVVNAIDFQNGLEKIEVFVEIPPKAIKPAAMAAAFTDIVAFASDRNNVRTVRDYFEENSENDSRKFISIARAISGVDFEIEVIDHAEADLFELVAVDGKIEPLTVEVLRIKLEQLALYEKYIGNSKLNAAIKAQRGDK